MAGATAVVMADAMADESADLMETMSAASTAHTAVFAMADQTEISMADWKGADSDRSKAAYLAHGSDLTTAAQLALPMAD